MTLLVALIIALALLWAFSLVMTRSFERSFPPRGIRVPVTGGFLHVVDIAPRAPGRGTIILLHGASGNLADMTGVLGEPLAKRGFRVLVFDRPGSGYSDRPGGVAAAQPDRQAQLVREAAEACGVREAIVLGHSLAGAMTVNFALDHKDFTRAILLLSPVTRPWPGGIAAYYHIAASRYFGPLFNRLIAMPAGLLQMRRAIIQVFAPNPVPPDFAQDTAPWLVLRPANFGQNAQDVAVMHAFVTRQAPREAEVGVPTAIVTGDQDGVVLTHIHAFGSAAAIPGATLKVLKGVGHSPHHSAPEAVLESIEALAQRVMARPQAGRA
ncbi:MAG: alpha/beta hydrolase [Hyphomicrobiales bacterium]|nr:alpha/beta hydrolase [Hyphomicrobiales bacterium]